MSIRQVFPMNIVGDDKLLCIDLTEFDADETKEYEILLEEVHKDYIQSIKDIGLGSTFRTFFLEKMS